MDFKKLFKNFEQLHQNFKQLHKNFQKFLKFIQKNNLRKVQFSLVLFLFLTFPQQNYYFTLQAQPGEPVLREIPEITFEEQTSYPVNKTKTPPPFLSAKSCLIIDLDSKAVIFAKNPDLSILPASTTKIMTALIAQEYYQFDQVLEIRKPNRIGQIMKLEEGEKITVENLLYGLLVASANDAAYTLAENYPGGLENFIKKMNEKGKALHLENSVFTNPAGIEEAEHFSTAHDLAILAREALKNPFFLQAVSTKKITVLDTSGEIKHPLENLNELLGEIPGVFGIKTGWTENAGECLITLLEHNNKKILLVLMGSQNRFGETKKLINWVFENFQWE